MRPDLLAFVSGSAILLAVTGCAAHANPTPVRVGAVFPLSGPAGSLGQEELAALRVAADMVNADGGIGGRRLVLEVRDVSRVSEAGPAVESLRHRGVDVVVGGYSSDLSVEASAAAARAGLVYWEAGAVADRITGRGLPRVFRVGATGGQLGANAARFTLQEIAPRLHVRAAALRVTQVVADDDYGNSVADAAGAVLAAEGVTVTRVGYQASAPLWAPALADVRASLPHVLLLSSHIPDGIAFRRAFLSAHLHVDAFLGTTMAQCPPSFSEALGADAIGVFASDRPDEALSASLLPTAGRALHARLSDAWEKQHGDAPDDEALSGFSAGWVLFHHVLPAALQRGPLTPAGIAAAAREVNLPSGSLPNGAGVRFARSSAELGQNLRAAAIIEQYQAARHAVVVWPAEYATGTTKFVPLPG